MKGIYPLQRVFRILTLQFRIIKIQSDGHELEAKLSCMESVAGCQRQNRGMTMFPHLMRQRNQRLRVPQGTKVGQDCAHDYVLRLRLSFRAPAAGSACDELPDLA